MRKVKFILAIVVISVVVYAAYASIGTNPVTYHLHATALKLSLKTSPPTTMLAQSADTEFLQLSTSVPVSGSVIVTVINSTSTANQFQLAEAFNLSINGTSYTPPTPPVGNNFSHRFGPYSIGVPGTVFNCTLFVGVSGDYDVFAVFYAS